MSAATAIIRRTPDLFFRPSRFAREFRTFIWHRIFPVDPEASRLASWETGRLPRVTLPEIFPGSIFKRIRP